MRGKAMFAVAAVLGLVVFFTISICSPLDAQMKKVTTLEGVKYDTASSMADNLKANAGKDVTVHIRSGKTIQGYVKSVGNNLVHVEKIAGRDFYDVLIRIEEISAVEIKFRDMK